MPTLFDSHEEFNEWFSKDIESHAENKSAIDESEYAWFSILCIQILQLEQNCPYVLTTSCYKLRTLEELH